MASIYDLNFSVEGLEGQKIELSSFRGKKLLIVNVASECGFTPQYVQLQDLYSEFQDKLVVIGFPSNDFGGQEPGSAKEIKAFCSKNFGVTFPLAAKSAIVKAPQNQVFQWLTRKALNGKFDSEVTWNFQKFLLDEAGDLLAVFPPSTDPCSDEILDYLL